MLKGISTDHMTAWKNRGVTGYAWAEDFVKALAERPRWIRLTLRFVFGKKAYREFIGLCDVLVASGTYLNYELDDMSYHKENVRTDFLEGAERY